MNQITPIPIQTTELLSFEVDEQSNSTHSKSITCQKQLLKPKSRYDSRKLRSNRLKQFLCHDSGSGTSSRSQAFNASFFRFLMQSKPEEIINKIDEYNNKSLREKVQLSACIEMFLPFLTERILDDVISKVDDLASVADITNEIRLSRDLHVRSNETIIEDRMLCFEFNNEISGDFIEESLDLLSNKLVSTLNPRSFLQGYITNCELNLAKVRSNNLSCELELEGSISKFNSAIWLGAVFELFGYEKSQINSSQLFVRKGISRGAIEDISFIMPLTRVINGSRAEKYQQLSYLTMLSPSCLFPDYDGDSSQIQNDTCMFLKGMAS